LQQRGFAELVVQEARVHQESMRVLASQVIAELFDLAFEFDQRVRDEFVRDRLTVVKLPRQEDFEPPK